MMATTIDQADGTGLKVCGVAMPSPMQINLVCSEGTKLVLHLSNLQAIPLADPTLIIGGLGARRKNRRWKVEKALPLGA
jgi:hypothetical protein